jgi:hypothetical protein
MTAAGLASGCEIVSLCNVFPLRYLHDVSPAMSGVNLTHSSTQGMQTARAVKENSLRKLLLTRCAHVSASATCGGALLLDTLRELESP